MKNKNAGAYCIKAELPKFWTQELVKEIEVILNEIASTRNYPREVVVGITTAIQKPGKPKGPVENLRLITLSSILQNIAICLKKRTKS